MPSTRQDAWTADEDLLLAEVILRHIREGGTQLQAFEEVGRKLSRTSAACGFRWNSYVRKQYKTGIEHAKKQRKQGKKAMSEQRQGEQAPASEIQERDEAEKSRLPGFKDVISYLEKLHELAGGAESAVKETEQLMVRIKELEQENEKLCNEIARLEEDYQALMDILERARKMAADKEHGPQKVKFQVDKYGNLERID